MEFMKVAYIGERDCLTAAVLERLHKEGKEIYFLSGEPEEKGINQFSKYRHYQLTGESGDAHTIFSSITPDVVIYEGSSYLKEAWEMEQSTNLALLPSILEECVRQDCRFVLLSTVEIYGKGSGSVEESTEPHPRTVKGMWMLQEEQMTQMYQKQEGLSASILRLSQVFSKEIQVGAKDFMGTLAAKLEAVSELEEEALPVQPVYVSDVADALVRILDSGKSTIYNVCGSKVVTTVEILQQMNAAMGKEKQIREIKSTQENPHIENEKMISELEWTPIWSLGEMLEKGSIVFSVPQRQGRGKRTKKHSIKSGLRKTLENLVIFLIFGMLFLLTSHHTLFSQVDWLFIYVVLISLGYGVKQGALSVILSSMIYLVSQGESLLEMRNFYSYAANILVIVEFVFFGIVVGYTADLLREECHNLKRELERIKKSNEKLKLINDKTVLLKKEYEKRVLDAKTSLPHLYSIINRINVLDADRIFMEILRVIQELLQTDTVAVYRVCGNSSYLRLIAALNAKSVMEGNSWNLKECPAIDKAIEDNRIYEGNIWEKEPAVVLPITCSKGCKAVIVIRELSMEAQSLYSINLLRTLLILISDSLDKALQYDSAVRRQKYWRDTNILNPKEFRKALKLAEEKRQREVADYCIVKLDISQKMEETYHAAQGMFREVDVWGMDEAGCLYVLLSNTSVKEGTMVLERLKRSGITAEEINVQRQEEIWNS